MNICMLLNKDFATDYRVFKEAQSLQKAGHNVTVYTFEKNKKSQTIKVNGIRNSITGYNNSLQGKAKAMLLRYSKALTAKADAYHAHDIDTLPYAYLAAKIKAKPLIYDAHELATDVAGISKSKRRKLIKKERRLSKKAKLVITANEFRKQIFQKRYNLKRIIVLENFPNTNTKKEKKDTFTFLYVGVLGKGRSLDKIIQAANQINCRLKIVGYGNQEKQLKKLANNNIEFKGKVTFTQVQEECRKADVGFLLLENTSKNNYYAAPNKIYDYMQGACISIVSNLPGLKAVKQEKVGLTIEPTTENIKKAMQWCINNKQKVKEMQKRSYNLAQKKYNWEQQEHRLIQAYETL